MLDVNVSRLMKELSETDVVLDVGGWACPFNRAQWILDAQPFETRGFYRNFGGKPSQGGDKEWFTKNTWIQRDMCDRSVAVPRKSSTSWCAPTLKSLRSALGVPRADSRGQRDYIEVPSSLRDDHRDGAARPGRALASSMASRCRWHPHFVSPEMPQIHADWRFHLPHRVKNRVSSDAMSGYLCGATLHVRGREIHGLRCTAAGTRTFSTGVPR
jgi:hypothetical protein